MYSELQTLLTFRTSPFFSYLWGNDNYLSLLIGAKMKKDIVNKHEQNLRLLSICTTTMIVVVDNDDSDTYSNAIVVIGRGFACNVTVKESRKLVTQQRCNISYEWHLYSLTQSLT